MTFAPGQKIGAYRIIRLLGESGMGAVYEVEHEQLGVRYALKAFTAQDGYVDVLKKKFLAEGKVLARLRDPHLIRVFDLAIDEATGVSKGTKANTFPVSYIAEAPKGGWSSEYKTKKLVLRKIPAGKDPIGRYTLSKDFYIAIFETTQKQWELLSGKNPSEIKSDKLPVSMVAYSEICGNTGFAKQLTQKTSLGKFDLPTEAQWEYASRAGVTTRYSNGDSEADLDKTGWYNKNSNGKLMEVGLKLPNAWGVFDMQGNLWERCKDFSSPMRGTDPVGDISGGNCANCGGQTRDGAGCCWHGGRARSHLTDAWGDRGFRIVLNVK